MSTYPHVVLLWQKPCAVTLIKQRQFKEVDTMRSRMEVFIHSDDKTCCFCNGCCFHQKHLIWLYNFIFYLFLRTTHCVLYCITVAHANSTQKDHSQLVDRNTGPHCFKTAVLPSAVFSDSFRNSTSSDIPVDFVGGSRQTLQQQYHIQVHII